MAVSAGFAVRRLGGDLDFLAGGMDVSHLIGTFVKAIVDDGTHLEITLQAADGTESTFRWAGGATIAGSGWTPLLAVVVDGDRRVLRVVDWEGGTGNKPTVGQYVGPTGLVAAVADAVDIRGGIGATGHVGPEGPRGQDGQTGQTGADGADGADGDTGWSPAFSIATDSARRVLQVASWQGGTGTPPATGQYVGAAGLVSDIADAVDIRGPAAGLGPADGIPTYAAGSEAYDETANALSMSITGVPTLTPPAILFFLAPTDFPRDDGAMELRVGGFDRPLRDIFGAAVRARDITPGMLVEVIARADGEYRIVEPLSPRPQDFAVHKFYFTPTNSANTGAPDFEDPAFTLTQAAIDAATYHTMSTTTAPRVSWPTGYVPNRTVASDEDDAYDDQFLFWTYYAVPANAPDIRGVGLGRSTNYPGESAPRGWRGTLGTVLPENRVAGTFDIGGVAHKFIRFVESITPDEANDPPTTWESLYRGTPYSVIAFDGLPDPPITT